MKTRPFASLAALLLLSGVALAGTPVSWSIERIDTVLDAGSTKQMTFTFLSSDNLGNVKFNIVPELLPYVQISPVSISNVTAGSSTDIHVTLKAGLTTQSFAVNGVIQARAASGAQKVFAQPLPVQLMIRFNPIAGVDADGNGIWDYVDTYIAQTYANDPEIVPAIQQAARAVQSSLLDSKDHNLSLQHAVEYDRASDCVFSFGVGRGTEAYDMLSKLDAAILNTRERSLAEAVFGEHSAGHVFELLPVGQKRNGCAF